MRDSSILKKTFYGLKIFSLHLDIAVSLMKGKEKNDM